VLEHLGTAAQCFAEGLRADRHDHEFLDVQIVVGVRAAVDDIHHRHRHLHRAGTTEIAIQRQAGFFRRRLGHRHRNRQHGVRAEARLVLGIVEVDQRLVDEGLLFGVQPQDGFGNFGIDVFDRALDALAQITPGVAIAQLDGFARAGGRTRGHGGTAHDARFEQHIGFNGGIAARIENFAGDDINNGTHDEPLAN